MHLTHLVVDACVEQDPLRSRRLACIHVGTDTDVTVAIDRGCTGHN
ncbi:hypothetical protein AvCA_06210 [Azotobacter vinelandii CA]|uniref:Uncharacterized protein n=2 Tax=Azotobacter vinelandii TaxID=354 RepID=C1DKK9_AZOVD|nr:Conserved hypothetical protein [Azotobacter vinelandii DJ]AGK17234.1 hypothetical protein AvCA_06210 [Azotobacter vinelandii CA]AGK19424.1 hypothetical protein AvCA6_06210 [Azotobacter vinelandii CA6]